MRRILFLLCLAIMTVISVSGATVKACDPQVSITGRVMKAADGSVSYDWVGVYLQTEFTGSSVSAIVAEQGESWHNIYIDGKLREKILVKGKDAHEVVLADKLPKGRHRLMLQKVTEGEYGLFTIYSLTAKGDFGSVAKKARFIEFIGDSYTCGYGTEGANAKERFKLSTENFSHSYAYHVARYFDADYSIVAHSGMGVTRNYNGKTMRNMSQRYPLVYDDHDSVAYHFDQYKPDLVVICLGANDFSVNGAPLNFVPQYVKLIETVREHYGEVPVFCVISHSANMYQLAAMDELRQQVRNMKGVTVAKPMTGLMLYDQDLGSDHHPNKQGHNKIAMMLIPQIATAAGWKMRDSTLF